MLTLYKQPLPEATTDQNRNELGTVLAEQGALEGDALVQALSSEAADLSLTGSYAAGDWAPLLAGELKEISDASLGALPVFGAGDVSDLDSGYYEVESADVGPPHAVGKRVYEWDLSLTKVGTRKSHLRAVETNVTPPELDHEFGTDTDARVGIPSAATGVRMIDSTSEPTQRDTASPVETAQTPHGAIDMFDASTESIENPIYIYRVPYEQEAAVDVHVYDTLGRDGKYIEGQNGRVRQWQSVYARDHEFVGEIVLSSGRLRLTIDEPTNADATAALEAEQWDETGDQWTTVDLPVSDWQPIDVDLARIGQVSVEGYLTFQATAGSREGDVVTLQFQLSRGQSSVLFWGVTNLPAGLETLLEPIAATTVVDSMARQTLVRREDVRAAGVIGGGSTPGTGGDLRITRTTVEEVGSGFQVTVTDTQFTGSAETAGDFQVTVTDTQFAGSAETAGDFQVTVTDTQFTGSAETAGDFQVTVTDTQFTGSAETAGDFQITVTDTQFTA